MRYSEYSDWRLTTDTLPLYKRQRHRAGHVLLRALDERVEGLAQGREPEAEIHQLRILQPNVLLEMRDIAFQAERFKFAMRRQSARFRPASRNIRAT